MTKHVAAIALSGGGLACGKVAADLATMPGWAPYGAGAAVFLGIFSTAGAGAHVWRNYGVGERLRRAIRGPGRRD